MVSIAHLDKFKNKKINTMIKIIIFTLFILCHYTLVAQVSYSIPIQENNESIVEGKFEPTWESLRQYKVPEWFRDAKFGIWAH